LCETWRTIRLNYYVFFYMLVKEVFS